MAGWLGCESPHFLLLSPLLLSRLSVSASPALLLLRPLCHSPMSLLLRALSLPLPPFSRSVWLGWLLFSLAALYLSVLLVACCPWVSLISSRCRCCSWRVRQSCLSCIVYKGWQRCRCDLDNNEAVMFASCDVRDELQHFGAHLWQLPDITMVQSRAEGCTAEESPLESTSMPQCLMPRLCHVTCQQAPACGRASAATYW